MIYSCNEGNFDSWDQEIKRTVMGFKSASPAWSQRYVGSMVSDVHRTLLYGGLFLYPADKKSTKGTQYTPGRYSPYLFFVFFLWMVYNMCSSSNGNG